MSNFDSDDVVGYSLRIRVKKTAMLTQTIEKHWVGSEATCRRKARLITGYDSIESIEPVTGRQWISGYGDPRIRSKFS